MQPLECAKGLCLQRVCVCVCVYVLHTLSYEAPQKNVSYTDKKLLLLLLLQLLLLLLLLWQLLLLLLLPFVNALIVCCWPLLK